MLLVVIPGIIPFCWLYIAKCKPTGTYTFLLLSKLISLVQAVINGLSMIALILMFAMICNSTTTSVFTHRTSTTCLRCMCEHMALRKFFVAFVCFLKCLFLLFFTLKCIAITQGANRPSCNSTLNMRGPHYEDVGGLLDP